MMVLLPHARSEPSCAAHPSTPRTKPTLSEGQGLARLQKILAAAGVGSRRQCEEVILEGRVEVDRKVVSQLGAKADPFRQEIRLDGNLLAKPKRVYYLVHKPPGVLSTNRDPAGRPRVVDLLAPRGERLFTVGRLDMSSEGLILATNDGELANLLTHPRYGVEKTYHVEVAGAIDRDGIGPAGRRDVSGRRICAGGRRTDQKPLQKKHAVGNHARRRTQPRNPPTAGPHRAQSHAAAADRARPTPTGRSPQRSLSPADRRRSPCLCGKPRPLPPGGSARRFNVPRRPAKRRQPAIRPNRSGTRLTTAAAKLPAMQNRQQRHGRRSDKEAGRAVRPPRRESGARRASAAADVEEPVQFRLPRGGAIGGDEPRRAVVIGGDSSSFGPRRSKPAGRIKPERPSQVSRPPKIGAATHPLDEPAEDAEETGAEPANRPAKQRWLGPGRRKAGSRPGGVGRPNSCGCAGQSERSGQSRPVERNTRHRRKRPAASNGAGPGAGSRHDASARRGLLRRSRGR